MIRSLLLPLAVLLGLAAAAGHAQSGLGDAVIFTGLTTTSGAENYAWLSWHPTDPAVLRSRALAVYRKTGNANSNAPFARIAVIEPATDTRLVSSLLPVAQLVGQDLPALTTMLDELLGDATPAASVSVAAKISTLVSAANGDSDRTQRLYVLALQHPAMALCAGVAHADKIPATGAITYELRDFNKAGDRDWGVIGRVTVNAATPFALPAPGSAVEVPDTSAKGNLNVSLRWATPDVLRDVAPLHHGFSLYRVPQATAVARGWHTTAPTAAAIAAEPLAARVNRYPIVPAKMLTLVEAADLADKATIFTTDDHGRFLPGGTPFADNAAFYYFVAARDILGRPGQLSAGSLVRIFDRLPPPVPVRTRVRNIPQYGAAPVAPGGRLAAAGPAGGIKQSFSISWDLPELPPGETVSAWYVYRWRSPKEIPSLSRQLDPVTGKPERNLIALLPGTAREFTDDGSIAPPAWALNDEPAPDAADKGKTYYYTVRAADGSVSANLSGNSAPSWGVLRDRSGPPPTSGMVQLTRHLPTVAFVAYQQVPSAGLSPDREQLLLTCTSTLAKGLEWAEFRYFTSTQPFQKVSLGRARFTKNAAGQLVAVLRKTTTFPSGQESITMECQVRTAAGAVSAWVGQGHAPYALGNHSISAKWQAVLAPSVTNGVTAGWRHEAADPATGATTDVTGTFTAPTEAKEFRVYRRVNESAQSLVTQGEVFALPITWRDTAQINCCGEVEYALQTFDTHGNPSPLVPQGEPITVAASLPVPMLEPLTFVGPLENAGMRIAFFSSSDCVERFEIWVARKSGQIASSEGSIGLSGDIASHPNFHAATGPTAGLDFAIFSTGVARHLNADGAPQYDFVIPVSITDTYTVTVRAVGKGTPSERALGAFSNIETKSFGLGDGAELPWPDRPLPSTVGEFHPGITATYLDVNDLAPWKGNAVRIGEYSDPAFGGATTAIPSGTQPPGVLYQISGSRAPIFHLYTNDAIALAEPKETIPGLVLPVALYRVQVANTTFPIVPGDIVQVSPLLEQIAYKPRGANGITVTDPFVAALFEADTDLPHTAPEFDHDILLLDRQPVIKGARYKYLLVRFSPGREIDRVIVTNTVDVPLTP